MIVSVLLVVVAITSVLIILFYMAKSKILEPVSLTSRVKGSLHDLYAILRRAPKSTRPKVQIRGSKNKPFVCQICLGRIKNGLDYAVCSCGKIFHLVCIQRTGFCPYCEEIFSDDNSKWKLISNEEKTLFAAGNKVDRQLVDSFKCPICGTQNPLTSDSCKCGAIFVHEGEIFLCPSCGAFVREQDNICSNCGEVFERYELDICPLCGATIENADVCDRCGAVFGNKCPECGHELKPDESICMYCGTVFELI
ncbi:MAG: zinc-ribbon domain-containing protein [Methanomassiliicoccales archaeon]|nr:zinc-ribbon domain-containing protein [Methanomassiliicoccales archaeon]